MYFFTTCKKIYKHLYLKKNIKNKSRNPKTLPECHCIGKIMKYPRISPKFTKMPLAARVAHAWLLLEAVKFSGAISGQKMVASGRSEGADSDGGGLDGRWWLKRENRRFEASVADKNRGPFPARWWGENAENGRGFDLYEDRNLSVVVRKPQTAVNGRSEERERIAGERRERLWDVLRCERAHGAPVPLKAVNRWISGERILRLLLAGSASWSTVRMC